MTQGTSTRRGFLKTLGAGALAATQALRAGERRPRGRPNVLVVLTDDQGWGDMGYYGHPALKTPNFDATAAAGLRFDRFYAAAIASKWGVFRTGWRL